MLNKKKRETLTKDTIAVIFLVVGLFFFLFSDFARADPVGIDSSGVTILANETAATSGYMLNVTGGRIVTLNITGAIQNSHWKAFVGWVSGSFTLKDQSGSKIYDWTMSTASGEVYATRNSSTITWTGLACASAANVETENARLGMTNPDDNITKTFNSATHREFFVAGTNISLNSCPRTLNTYQNNVSQDAVFEEIALYEAVGSNIVYATILENKTTPGFDSVNYDFQMLAPESSTPDVTAYYLYVEIS
jgi:hypothetical protein